MTDAEVIERLVVDLGFEIDRKSEAAIKKYADYIDRLKQQGRVNVGLSIGENIDTFSQKIKRSFLGKITPAPEIPKVNETIPVSPTLKIPKIGSGITRKYKDTKLLQQAESLWDRTLDLKTKTHMESVLAKNGWDAAGRSGGEKLLAYRAFQVQKKEIAQTKIAEKARTAIYAKAQAERTGLFSRAFSVLKRFIPGFRAGFGLYAAARLTRQVGGFARDVGTQALLSNMTPEDTQRIQGFARQLGVAPEELHATLQAYRRKTGNYSKSDEDVLNDLIRQAKSPRASAQGALMNEASPKVFRALREYKGALSKALANQKNIFSSEELKEFEQLEIRFNLFGEKIQYWLKYTAIFFNKFLTFGEKLYDKISGFKYIFSDNEEKTLKNEPREITDRELQKLEKKWMNSGKVTPKNIQRRMSEEDYKELTRADNIYSPKQDITINNNFNIQGDSPRTIAEEVRRRLSEEDYEELLRMSDMRVTPNAVR